MFCVRDHGPRTGARNTTSGYCSRIISRTICRPLDVTMLNPFRILIGVPTFTPVNAQHWLRRALPAIISSGSFHGEHNSNENTLVASSVRMAEGPRCDVLERTLFRGENSKMVLPVQLVFNASCGFLSSFQMRISWVPSTYWISLALCPVSEWICVGQPASTGVTMARRGSLCSLMTRFLDLSAFHLAE